MYSFTLSTVYKIAILSSNDSNAGLDIKHSHVVVLRTSTFVIYLSEYKSYLPEEKILF